MNSEDLISEGYHPYDGDYQKEFYDIVTDQFIKVNNCWPNNGWFIPASGKYIHESNVIYFRVVIEK